ncbi:hypothetical protein [Methanosarcina siciliae]|uniref:hypothetical protein n=1 Tax=Methanosarcina siciliae TaxID=38027 RepID=UPI000B315E2D|nr:hypothetical protein [Methanosarcina siciliae]
MEKFRKVYIKQRTSKNLNERDKYTVLCINPPTPNSLVHPSHETIICFSCFWKIASNEYLQEEEAPLKRDSKQNSFSSSTKLNARGTERFPGSSEIAPGAEIFPLLKTYNRRETPL